VPETFSFILKNGPFLLRPSTLTEDLLLIVDFAKTLPFFNKMYLSDKVLIITQDTLRELKNVFTDLSSYIHCYAPRHTC